MSVHTKYGNVVVFMALFLAVVPLGACGNSNKKSTSPAAGAPLSSAATVGINVCAACHTEVTADWLTSRHANAEGGLASAGTPTPGQISSCITNCHDLNGDSANIIAAGYLGSVARPIVGCETCHGGGSLHTGSGPIALLSNATGSALGGSVPVSGQFVMCTKCHELLDATGTTVNPSPAHATTAPTGPQNYITDTHVAAAGDWSGVGGAGSKAISGYAMDYTNERVCVTCHNPHKPATHNREWAQSAHADKNYLNLSVLGTGYFSGAWTHYNWSTKPTCQRCHTTTGFSAYADALRNGNPALAEAINLGTSASPPLASTATWKPEMLTCNGCHLDTRGNLRNPGAITANYDYVSSGSTYAKASHTYPDVAGSNVCMACHVGRETGETIRGLNDPALLLAGTIKPFDFSNKGFINSHYLTSGGQVFTTTGYEFAGRPYNNLPEYRHDKIGTPATLQLAPFVNTGSNGPCVGCHMSRPNTNGNHLFLPVSRGTTTLGQVTGIASEVCSNCHGPSTTLILDMVREQKLQYTEAMEALKDQIEAKLHLYFFPANPFWYTTPAYTDPKAACTENVPVKNWQTGGTQAAPGGTYDPGTGGGCTYTGNNDGESGTGQNNMGAAFNFNLLEHDPGAYVHNRLYVKRLLYDSIDWVDDGIMNYSVGATLQALDPATSPYRSEAMTYLLPSGVLGIEAERP